MLANKNARFSFIHSFPRKAMVSGALAGLMTASLAKPSLAADTMPASSMETKSTGRVSSANLLNPGQIGLGMSYQRSDSPVPTLVLGGEKAKTSKQTKLVNHIDQMSVTLGLGVAKFLDLNLSVHATQESLDSEAAKELYSDEEFKDDKNQNQAASSAFSGVSALAKFRFVEQPGLKLAFAPFMKSGAGDTANRSVSRSEKASGGWMLIGTYGAGGLAEINVNGGYRYRERERIGEWSLRNELFYQASVETFINDYFSLFASGLGRRLKVAKDEHQTHGEKTAYENANSAEFTAGVNLAYKGYNFGAYGGSRLQEKSLGAGRSIFGLTVGYTFKSKSRSAPESSNVIFAGDETEEQRKADENKSMDNWNPKVGKEVNPEEYEKVGAGNYIDMNGKTGNIYDGLDKKPKGADKEYTIPEDDFSVMEKRMKKAKPKQKGEPVAQDALVEAELKKLREAEAKAEEAAEKQRRKEEKSRREQLRQETRENQETYRKHRREVLQETETLPEVTDEEISWDGLN